MPKVGFTQTEWHKKLQLMADSGKLNNGKGGTPTDVNIKAMYDKILICRRHKQINSSSITTFFTHKSSVTDTDECTCGFHKTAKRKVSSSSTSTTSTSSLLVSSPRKNKKGKFIIRPGQSLSPRIPVVSTAIVPTKNQVYDIGCSLPQIPTKLSFSEVQDNPIKTITMDGFLDLFIFAPINGFCPFCKSRKIYAKRNSTHLKMVLRMYNFPFYCQRVDIDCKECKKMIISSDSRYVETLPHHTRFKMTFFHTGACTGIDYNMIRGMRNGMSAVTVQQMASGAIELLYSNLVREYVNTAEAAIASVLTNYSTYKLFPPLQKAWMAASYLIVAAFIRDFSMNRDELCRELQSYVSKLSLAVDHQKKVVNRVKKTNDELQIGKQSFVIVGDLGLIMNYVVVPDTSDHWTESAMDEVYNRHINNGIYNGPLTVFVDCGCCNGKLNTQNESTTAIEDDTVSLFYVVSLLSSIRVIVTYFWIILYFIFYIFLYI